MATTTPPAATSTPPSHSKVFRIGPSPGADVTKAIGAAQAKPSRTGSATATLPVAAHGHINRAGDVVLAVVELAPVGVAVDLAHGRGLGRPPRGRCAGRRDGVGRCRGAPVLRPASGPLCGWRRRTIPSRRRSRTPPRGLRHRLSASGETGNQDWGGEHCGSPSRRAASHGAASLGVSDPSAPIPTPTAAVRWCYSEGHLATVDSGASGCEDRSKRTGLIREAAGMLTLDYANGGCSMAPHMVLEESGERYAGRRLDFSKGEQRTEAYLKIHPLGRVPALLLDSGEPLTENAAILPISASASGCGPPSCSPRRGRCRRSASSPARCTPPTPTSPAPSATPPTSRTSPTSRRGDARASTPTEADRRHAGGARVAPTSTPCSTLTPSPSMSGRPPRAAGGRA